MMKINKCLYELFIDMVYLNFNINKCLYELNYEIIKMHLLVIS